jgi:hypothetical protein
MTAPTIDLRPARPATCHPQRELCAHGMCRPCYDAAGWRGRRKQPDEVLVERIIRGEHHPGRVRLAESVEVVRRMAARGYSDGQIAYRLGRPVRSVLRTRARHGIPAALPRGGANQHSRHPGVPSISGKAAA